MSNPTHGTATVNSNGSYTIVPSAGYYGSDSFVYQATDGFSSSNATASYSVSDMAPSFSMNSGYLVLHDHTLTVGAGIGVLSYATDADGDAMTASVVTGPSHGTLTSFNSNGSFTYVPTSLWHGTDSIVVKASDGILNSGNATFNINVSDMAPSATNDIYTLVNGGTYNVSAANGVLHNDTDSDGDSMTANLGTGPAHGSLTLYATGAFAYTPNAGWLGQDSFTYTTSDGLMSSNTATVTLTTDYGIVSATDVTKLPLGTVQVDRQILGGITGTPATAGNLSLHYDSVAAHPMCVGKVGLGLNLG